MKLIVSLIALFLLPGSLFTCWDGILALVQGFGYTWWIAGGMGAGALIWFIALRYWDWFLVFEHELTHALVALLFFRKIKKFVVTRRDGGVVYHTSGFGGAFGDAMISLAPYFLPIFTLISTLFLPLVHEPGRRWYFGLIGFTLIYHTFSTFDEIPRNWTRRSFREAGSGKAAKSDIAKSGYLFSFIFILCMTLFIHALIFWLMRWSYAGFVPFSKETFLRSKEIYIDIFQWVMRLVRPVTENVN